MKNVALAALVVLLCGMGLKLVVWKRDQQADVNRAKNEIAAIRAALLAYREEYGVSLDPGSNPYRVLTGGDNLRQIRFLVPIEGDRWPTDQYSDPWGHPYVFDLSLPDAPRIRSFGPDGRRSTDDVVGE